MTPYEEARERLALKPCPFCGGEAHKVSPGSERPDYVTCLSCSSGGPYRAGRDNVAAWNARSILSPEVGRGEIAAFLKDRDEALFEVPPEANDAERLISADCILALLRGGE